MKKPMHRTATWKQAGITIREIRPGYFQTDVMRDGRRVRQCFRTLEDARTHCEILATQIRNEGTDALRITPDQRHDAARALAVLAGRATLAAAAEFWAQHHAAAEGLSLADLADYWLVELERQGCRDTTLRERRQKTARLCRDYGDHPAATITRDMLVSWMDTLGLTGATRDGYRRCFSAMFNFGTRHDPPLVRHNPVAGIRKMRADETLPTPFTVKQTAAILAAARTHAPQVVPTLAVQFFAGLRPGEALGLDWQAVDFAEGILRVTPETSKVRRSRLIDMTPALKSWLLPYRRKAGPIGITTRNQQQHYLHRCPGPGGKRGILAAADVKWIQDGPRKTFASAHYATHQDAARLAAILGHTGGADVLFRHYRGMMAKTAAAKYWKLRPSVAGPGQIIRIQQGAG